MTGAECRNAPSAPVAGRGELLLVVDDEAAIREITKATLEAYNYKVITARDGVEAVALFQQSWREIALVLTDMSMPVMDGQQLAGKLWEIHPPAKVLFISGSDSVGGIGPAAESPKAHLLVKPYTNEALLNAVNAMLAAGAAAGEAAGIRSGSAV